LSLLSALCLVSRHHVKTTGSGHHVSDSITDLLFDGGDSSWPGFPRSRIVFLSKGVLRPEGFRLDKEVSSRKYGLANPVVLQLLRLRTTIPIQDMNRASNDSGFSAARSIGILRGSLAGTTVLAIALTAVSFVSSNSQLAAGAPQLVLDKARHEFGEVFAGEDLSHVFWVRNIGTAPLELSETPLLGTRPSKGSFRRLPGDLTTRPVPKPAPS